LDPAAYGSAELVEQMVKDGFEKYSKYKKLIMEHVK
jgi:hypothetical protein